MKFAYCSNILWIFCWVERRGSTPWTCRLPGRMSSAAGSATGPTSGTYYWPFFHFFIIRILVWRKKILWERSSVRDPWLCGVFLAKGCGSNSIRLLSSVTLKLLANEKRGGLTMLSFDRSPFKLSSLKFADKSVQAPSCERPKTTQRTLFLLFANNNCFQITA